MPRALSTNPRRHRREIGVADNELANHSGITLADLDEKALARFVCWRRGRRRGYDRTPYRAQRFLRYPREAGFASSRAPSPLGSVMVVEFSAWMREQRGLAESTVAGTVEVAQAFLDALGEDSARWNAASVRQFVLGYVRQHAPSSAGLVTTNLRRFLRYLSARDRWSPDLIEAVPKVPAWRKARLPGYLIKSGQAHSGRVKAYRLGLPRLDRWTRLMRILHRGLFFS